MQIKLHPTLINFWISERKKIYKAVIAFAEHINLLMVPSHWIIWFEWWPLHFNRLRHLRGTLECTCSSNDSASCSLVSATIFPAVLWNWFLPIHPSTPENEIMKSGCEHRFGVFHFFFPSHFTSRLSLSKTSLLSISSFWKIWWLDANSSNAWLSKCTGSSIYVLDDIDEWRPIKIETAWRALIYCDIDIFPQNRIYNLCQNWRSDK